MVSDRNSKGPNSHRVQGSDSPSVHWSEDPTHFSPGSFRSRDISFAGHFGPGHFGPLSFHLRVLSVLIILVPCHFSL